MPIQESDRPVGNTRTHAALLFGFALPVLDPRIMNSASTHILGGPAEVALAAGAAVLVLATVIACAELVVRLVSERHSLEGPGFPVLSLSLIHI